MACLYPYADSADPLFRPAKGLASSDFFQHWGQSDLANDRLLAAELSRLAYADEPIVRQALTQIGFSLQGWVGGDKALHARFAAWGSDGFVASSPDRRVAIAFRGTESDKPEDLLVDLLAKAVPGPSGTQVHQGFDEALKHVTPALTAALAKAGPGSLLITGHSLGAGLATIAAASLQERNPHLVTFGSPRVGNSDFARLFAHAAVDRFVNCCDMVARVPPEAFDRSHIEELLAELTGSAAASASAAIVLAPILSAAGLTAHFAHIGPAQYIDHSGQVIGQATDQRIRSDQQQARQAYRQTHAVASTTAGTLGAAVGGLGAAIAGGTPVATALRRALAPFFPGLVGGTVPIRDLSDHAPINYVSAIVGSFGIAPRSC